MTMKEKNQERRSKELNQIKQVDMTYVLSELGISRHKKSFSLRSERAPSCYIHTDKITGVNVFLDYGGSSKGTNIDLVMQAKNWNYPQAVRWLRERFLDGSYTPVAHTSHTQGKSTAQEESTWRIIRNEPVSPRFGIDLLSYRRMTPKDTRRLGIKALRIQHSVEQFRKIWLCGFQLLSGGWACFEPKPKGFKCVVAPNGLGFVSGSINQLIFAESICDGISAQKLCGGMMINSDLLIAPVPLAARAGRASLKRLQGKGRYDRIIIATDNDPPGKKAAEIILNIIGDDLGPTERLAMTAKDPCEELLSRKR